jgi:L-2,4-diaminobutyric acid acetyltransferase
MSGAQIVRSSPAGLQFFVPTARDGAGVFGLVRAAGTLELNSSYAYLLLCDRFASTCQVAYFHGEIAGAVLGFRPPAQPDTVFVWQIAVRSDARQSGLGRLLLERLIESDGCRGVRFLEAHVTSDNKASEALFCAFARARSAELVHAEGYSASDFPGVHAPERLIRIGPLG